MNAIELTLFSSRLNAICDEMGVVLRRTAFSPNIRDRLDFSCAIFDLNGDLCAQAAHIPVHLGSMAYAMRDVIDRLEWSQGDMVVFNDPFLGGTHLPDVTLVAPVFVDDVLQGYVANRAHHADIGADSPGSMPLSSSLQQEGIILQPDYLLKQGHWREHIRDRLVAATRNPTESMGDFNAQISANHAGVERLSLFISQAQGSAGPDAFQAGVDALNAYGERLSRRMLREIPDGLYSFEDVMDDDGQGTQNIPIRVVMTVDDGRCLLDFDGSASQVAGNINCPLSVTAAAAYYVFRCLMPQQTPACAGIFRPIEIKAPQGSLLNARRPAAVAAGNVETSTRVVDVVMGALAQAIPERIPAASHGSMNNLAMGSDRGSVWDYYETIGGGMGAGALHHGLSAVQTHMTNTLNTPIEVIESLFPLQITEYAVREGSGGAGHHHGGEGLIRSWKFLQAAQLTLLTERRAHAPWGLQGGEAGARGKNLLNGIEQPAKCHLHVDAGDELRIETPGGGGFGRIES
ncbi:MAG: hydantoinase B/oxoprolinase family protein [Pseudomonadota bacterium]|nr:hydantoinase B/oxoprolinase family protein [Pseudomonadota bacterium]